MLVNHDFCQIAWLALFNSGMRIKYDRTCQQSIKIISIEKTFALHKSAQKKHFFLEFFLKESSWWALFNHLKIANLEKWWFFTLDDTLNCTGIAEVRGTNPVRAGIFYSGFLFATAKVAYITAMIIILHLIRLSVVHIIWFLYIQNFIKKKNSHALYY